MTIVYAHREEVLYACPLLSLGIDAVAVVSAGCRFHSVRIIRFERPEWLTRGILYGMVSGGYKTGLRAQPIWRINGFEEELAQHGVQCRWADPRFPPAWASMQPAKVVQGNGSYV